MMTRTLTVTADCTLSGVDTISLDGGQTWIAMETIEDGSAFTARADGEVAAGSLLVRDLAGNHGSARKPMCTTGMGAAV